LGARTRWLPFELHPETPAGGAPKPLSDADWPAIQQRLRALADRVGLPIAPPSRNVNSRLALETGELVRARANDDAAARFHHAVSRAYFADGADISSFTVIAGHAGAEGVPESAVRAAWESHAFAGAIRDSMLAARAAGVRGVPAYGWPGTPAMSGMMERERIVQILRSTMPGA
jgi:predicted DsbA family dithiol-disulfide isomerase